MRIDRSFQIKNISQYNLTGKEIREKMFSFCFKHIEKLKGWKISKENCF